MKAGAIGLAAVILAGGLARRMGGGDKGLRRFADPSAGRDPARLLDLVIAALKRQRGGLISAICLNANGDPARFAEFGLAVIADPVPGNPGPLAGVLAGLEWASAQPGISHILSVPCDVPYLPDDLALRLLQPLAGGAAQLSCASSGGVSHPVVGIWPLSCRGDLRQALEVAQIRKVDRFTAGYPLANVAFPIGPPDPFFNANQPHDLTHPEG